MAHRLSRQKVPFQQGLEPFYKDLEALRQELAVRIEQRHRHGLRALFRHDLHKLARLQMAAHVIGGNLEEAKPRGTASDISLLAGVPAPGLGGQGLPRGILPPPPILACAG